MGLRPEISLIIPVKNEGGLIAQTLRSIRETCGQLAYEVVVVDDGSTDGCCDSLQQGWDGGPLTVLRTPGLGAARARNLGVEAAAGAKLLFCDGNILATEGLVGGLSALLDEPGVDLVGPGVGSPGSGSAAGFGLSWDERAMPYWLGHPVGMDLTPVPILGSGCLAMRADTFADLGGFDAAFRVLGHEDAELSLRAWLFGRELWVAPHLRVEHHFRAEKPYHLGFDHFMHNVVRTLYLHLSEERLDRLLNRLEPQSYAEQALAEVAASAAPLREQYLARRVHDDAWYVNRFRLPW